MARADLFIVDENKRDREALKSSLSSCNCVVTALDKGKSVLSKIKKNKLQIAVIDLNLRDMDSFDLIDKIKKKNKNAQIITVTARSTSAIRKRVAKVDVMFHSTKPKHLLQLPQIVDVTTEFHDLKEKQLVC